MQKRQWPTRSAKNPRDSPGRLWRLVADREERNEKSQSGGWADRAVERFMKLTQAMTRMKTAIIEKRRTFWRPAGRPDYGGGPWSGAEDRRIGGVRVCVFLVDISELGPEFIGRSSRPEEDVAGAHPFLPAGEAVFSQKFHLGQEVELNMGVGRDILDNPGNHEPPLYSSRKSTLPNGSSSPKYFRAVVSVRRIEFLSASA